jgi:hypothetical protein
VEEEKVQLLQKEINELSAIFDVSPEKKTKMRENVNWFFGIRKATVKNENPTKSEWSG